MQLRVRFITVGLLRHHPAATNKQRSKSQCLHPARCRFFFVMERHGPFAIVLRRVGVGSVLSAYILEISRPAGLLLGEPYSTVSFTSMLLRVALE